MPFPSLLLSLAVFGAIGDDPPPASLDALCDRYRGFDQDGDGTPEIASLALVQASEPRSAGGASVLVLVEGRLLQLESETPLRPSLERHAQDLATEGLGADLLSVELSTEGGHRDGRLLLALRRLVQDWSRQVPDPRGVILVGRFPDAYLIRTCNWRKREKATLKNAAGEKVQFDKVRYLRTIPEPVARRCDLVLGDLDGDWESHYHEGPTRLPRLSAAFPEGVPSQGGITEAWDLRSATHRDFFHVNDGRFDAHEVLDEEGELRGLYVRPLDFAADRECTDEDRQRPNVTARPELSVSRIDARGVALSPRSELLGADGQGLLDAQGRPRTVHFEGEAPSGSSVWSHDPQLELRLLVEYFDRNHRFRQGVRADDYRPASIAHDLGSGYRVVQRASDAWCEHDRASHDVHGHPRLNALVDWWKQPAVLRTLRAHSDSRVSVFAAPRLSALHEALGGAIWAWSRSGSELTPSLKDATSRGRAEFHLYRSLWQSGLGSRAGSILLHTGCNAISPPGAEKLPFHHASYGLRQGAESILFYTDSVVILGRAKVFYDEPIGFAETLAAGGTVGDAWRRYFEEQSLLPSWSKAGGDIGRKRSYFWSILGDWTLRMPPVIEAAGEESPRSSAAEASPQEDR